MKLLIDIPDKIYNRVAGTPLSDKTNGDIIKATFPDWEIEYVKKMSGLNRYDVKVDNFTRFSFYEEWWNAPYEAAEKQSDANLRFEWKDEPNIGYYECYLYEGDKKIDEINFTDYTCEFRQDYDRKNRYTRAYSFYASFCDGWSMDQGFDYDANYNNHSDVDGHLIGGYQGTSTHTVDDIKKWCENWLAQGYLKAYYNTMKKLDQMTARAKWFEDHGFCLEEKEA